MPSVMPSSGANDVPPGKPRERAFPIGHITTCLAHTPAKLPDRGVGACIATNVPGMSAQRMHSAYGAVIALATNVPTYAPTYRTPTNPINSTT